MANTGFKGLLELQTGSEIVAPFLFLDNNGNTVNGGSGYLIISELQSDGTLKGYDWNNNTFTTGVLVTPSGSLTPRTISSGLINTGIWTYSLGTLTGFTVGAKYLFQSNCSGASPQYQTRIYQYGGDEGDLLVTQGSTGQGYLQGDNLRWLGNPLLGPPPMPSGFAVTVVSNTDKTGYSLSVSPPTAAQIATYILQDISNTSDFTTPNSLGQLLLATSGLIGLIKIQTDKLLFDGSSYIKSDPQTSVTALNIPTISGIQNGLATLTNQTNILSEIISISGIIPSVSNLATLSQLQGVSGIIPSVGSIQAGLATSASIPTISGIQNLITTDIISISGIINTGSLNLTTANINQIASGVWVNPISSGIATLSELISISGIVPSVVNIQNGLATSTSQTTIINDILAMGIPWQSGIGVIVDTNRDKTNYQLAASAITAIQNGLVTLSQLTGVSGIIPTISGIQNNLSTLSQLQGVSGIIPSVASIQNGLATLTSIANLPTLSQLQSVSGIIPTISGIQSNIISNIISTSGLNGDFTSLMKTSLNASTPTSIQNIVAQTADIGARIPANLVMTGGKVWVLDDNGNPLPHTTDLTNTQNIITSDIISISGIVPTISGIQLGLATLSELISISGLLGSVNLTPTNIANIASGVAFDLVIPTVNQISSGVWTSPIASGIVSQLNSVSPIGANTINIYTIDGMSDIIPSAIVEVYASGSSTLIYTSSTDTLGHLATSLNNGIYSIYTYKPAYASWVNPFYATITSNSTINLVGTPFVITNPTTPSTARIYAYVTDLGLNAQAGINLIVQPSGEGNNGFNMQNVLLSQTMIGTTDSTGFVYLDIASNYPVHVRIPTAKFDYYFVTPSSGTFNLATLI